MSKIYDATDKPPQAYSMYRGSVDVCKRIGIRFNGKDTGNTVVSYNVLEGWVRFPKGIIMRGTVEPYWRAPI